MLGVVDSVKIVRRTDDPTKQGGSNDRVFDEVAGWLLGGGNILIFPEGTRIRHGRAAPLQSGFAGVYKLLGLPVVGIAVDAGPLYHRWWKRPGTIYRELKALGATDDAATQVAGNCHRWWRNSRGAINSVLTIAYFDRLGVPRLS